MKKLRAIWAFSIWGAPTEQDKTNLSQPSSSSFPFSILVKDNDER